MDLIILKIFITLFIIFLIPVYWRRYGMQNFLWLSDVGLFMTFFIVWLQSPLLNSMALVGIFILEFVWTVDYFVHLLTGNQFLEITNYMFDERIPKYVRALSFFHLITPAIWIWYLFQWGYVADAFVYQTIFVWLILIATYLWTDPEKNINWVFVSTVKHWKITPSLWLLFLLVGFPLILFLPLHLFLISYF